MRHCATWFEHGKPVAETDGAPTACREATAPGGRSCTGGKTFTKKYVAWLDALRFEQAGTQQTFEDYKAEVIHQDTRLARLDRQITEAIEAAPERLREVVRALQALRGVAQTTATVVAVEVGDFSRFVKPTQLMSWVGLVPREHSSGGPGKARRYGITKSGNSHLRRVLTEAAWLYRHSPNSSAAIKKRRENVAPSVVAIAEKAEQRLGARYRRMHGMGKPTNKVITAIGRELVGFAWAICRDVEQRLAARPKSSERRSRKAA
ncbi:MAG: transposase [Myxococcota bacterium]